MTARDAGTARALLANLQLAELEARYPGDDAKGAAVESIVLTFASEK